MKTKICPHCKTEKNESQYYKRRNDKNLGSYCKDCAILQTSQRQRQLKQDAIDYKGGKCLACSYDKYQGALEFHHLDPKEKEFTLAHVRHTSFNKIKSELDKCILLCSNCHREIHANIIFYNTETKQIECVNDIIYKEWNPTKTIKNTIDLKVIESRLKSKESLEEIAKSFSISKNYLRTILTANNIYISEMPEQQDILHSKKIEWPSIEEMEKLVWEKPTSQLSKDLGVSDVAIGKFCKKHNINKPPRGYWAKTESIFLSCQVEV